MSGPAPHRIPADHEVRREALDVRRSFLVQAPAGSGKTELLMQRLLALLAGVQEPEAVLAITFSRKAAAEMRARLLKALDDAQHGHPPANDHAAFNLSLARLVLDRDRERGWHLIERPHRLRLQTIDSFCSAVVAGLPWQSRMGAAPEVTDRPQRLLRMAALRTVRLLGDGSDEESAAARQLLLHVDNDVPRLRSLLAALLARRDQWLPLLGVQSDFAELRGRLEATLAEVATDAIEAVRRALPESLASELFSLAASAAAALGPDGESRVRACLGLGGVPDCTPASLPPWQGMADMLVRDDRGSFVWRRQVDVRNGFPPKRPETARIKELLRDELPSRPVLLEALGELARFPCITFDGSQWRTLSALLHLLPRAVARLRLIFGEERQCDFAEITLAALTALGDPEAPTDLGLAVGARIEHLLVDEFQDTSVSQWELLLRITAGWEPGDGRTLFLVGDPMQSIYRFRQANVGLFLSARSRGLGQLPLEPLTLTTNFRSHGGVVDWINRSFSRVFPAVENIDRGAVAYSASAALKESTAETTVRVHPRFEGGEEQEAAAVCDVVADRLRERPDGTTAVLVRSRAHLRATVAELKRRGIRYQAVEIDALCERQSIRDLMALTRALLDPSDRTAWLSLLRGPWCGLALADLHRLCAEDAPATLRERILAGTTGLGPDAEHRIGRLRSVLGRALAARQRLPLARWIEGAWIALGGPVCIAPAEMDDVDAYFDLLAACDEGGDLPDWSEFEERVAALHARPDTEAPGAVQLMTIHRAKGLEFDTVLVPGLDRRTMRDDEPLLLWLERAGRDGPGLLLSPCSPRGAQDPLGRYLRRIESERAREETRRLLYVATTRAREQLHLFGHVPWGGFVHDLRPETGSLLELLWPAVRDDFEAAAHAYAQRPAPEAATEPRLSLAASAEPSRLRRLPPAWTLPEPPPAVSWRRRSVAEWDAMLLSPLSAEGRSVFRLACDLLRERPSCGPAAADATAYDRLQRLLEQDGVAHGRTGECAARVQSMVKSVLQDQRGAWLFSSHEGAAFDLRLSVHAGASLHLVTVHRTFVQEGRRWLVFLTLDGAAGKAVAEDGRADWTRLLGVLHGCFEERSVCVGVYDLSARAWHEEQAAHGPAPL